MSTNITVTIARSGSWLWRIPVRNSWISSTASSCPIHGQWSVPGSSTNVAAGMWSAMYFPSSTGTARSSRLCKTSVGTRINGRTSRTSVCIDIRATATAAPGWRTVARAWQTTPGSAGHPVGNRRTRRGTAPRGPSSARGLRAIRPVRDRVPTDRSACRHRPRRTSRTR